MSMKQTMIGHRTPHIPDLEELLQAYTEVQMTQRAPQKKNTLTLNMWKTSACSVFT